MKNHELDCRWCDLLVVDLDEKILTIRSDNVRHRRALLHWWPVGLLVRRPQRRQVDAILQRYHTRDTRPPRIQNPVTSEPNETSTEQEPADQKQLARH